MKLLCALLFLLSACAVYRVGGDDGFESELPQEKAPEPESASQPAPLTADARPSCLAPPQSNPTPEQLATAKELFNHGIELYQIGEFEKAAARFLEAYQIVPKPQLLFNIGQAYRMAGQRQEAYEALVLFLCLAPDSPYRPEVERLLEEMRAAS